MQPQVVATPEIKQAKKIAPQNSLVPAHAKIYQRYCSQLHLKILKKVLGTLSSSQMFIYLGGEEPSQKGGNRCADSSLK